MYMRIEWNVLKSILQITIKDPVSSGHGIVMLIHSKSTLIKSNLFFALVIPSLLPVAGT
jgi:hypothetical protein